MSDPVGLVGLGLLGSALAARLRVAGYDVVGFDIDAECRERLGAAGGRPVTSAVAISDNCRRILLSLPDSDVSRTVIDELRPHLQPDAILIDTTTGDPTVMQRMGEELVAAGIGYLDATVAGSSVQARNGDVLILIGGDADVVSKCEDLWTALSANAVHVGPRGSGARMKLVVNLVLGLNRAVLAEGLSFARQMGIDPALALDVLQESPAASTVMQTKGQKMISGEFTLQARLRQHLKDVRLILEQSHDGTTPLSEMHAQLLQSLVEQGFGDEDNSAIIRAFDTRVETQFPER